MQMFLFDKSYLAYMKYTFTLEQKKILYEFFMSEIKKHGYQHNFFLNDIFDIPLIKRQKVVSSNHIKNVWTQYLNKKKSSEINIYIGMPYCYDRCTFCMYHMWVAKDSDMVKEYAKYLVNLIDYYKEILKIKPFHNLYFGGGTPSLLSEEDLKRIFEALFKYADFSDTSEKSFECNPFTTTYDKLKILKDFGFNRVSFGAQTLSPTVLSLINRDYQTNQMIFDCIKHSKELKFKQYNVDLVFGLYGETKQSFSQGFKKLVDAQPTSIMVYGCQPTNLYLNKYFKSNIKKFNSHFNNLRKHMPGLINYAKQNGYYVGDGNELETGKVAAVGFNLEGADVIEEVYNFNAGTGSIFGLGHHTHSYIRNKIRYTSSPPLRLDAEKNQYKVIDFSRKEQMIMNIYDQISDNGEISKRIFYKKFKRNIDEVFSDSIANLKKLGKLSEKEGELYLNYNSAKSRFLLGLFFIDPEKIIKAVNIPYTNNLIKIFVGSEFVVYRMEYKFNTVPPVAGCTRIKGNVSDTEISKLLDQIFSRKGKEPVKLRDDIELEIIRFFSQIKKKKPGLILKVAKKPVNQQAEHPES